MGDDVNQRVRRHREGLRESGLRPVQLWVPDTRQPGFQKECRRQSRLVAKADRADGELMVLIEAAAAELDGWTA